MTTTTNTPTVVLCPGQGAQHVGMGKSWFDHHPVAAQTYAAADRALGFSVSELCFKGPETQLNRTDIAQAAIYTTSVACYQAVFEAEQIGTVKATAGLSLGEFTALHIAGAFDFLDGLQLVRLRGQAMQAAAEATPSSMVALIGADEETANQLCEDAAKGDVLVPANFNCSGQVVISGSKAACERSLDVAEKMGLRATQLAVAGAFHSPLMQPAADQLATALDEVQWNTPAVTVYSNVTARPHAIEDLASIKLRLVEQLTSPVRWSQSMEHMLASHAEDRLVELAPGKVLSGLMRRIDRKAKVENFAEAPAPA
ncbi:ACP S-malonyltransferase [Phycisphaerales bacterium AB-hyl4]|uniref:Malonyl CoA-acyl carrier protein transacylase n=1 Tax=Natronomicrosphaera hydrolytica TaxID=3242702 RepID=A0ABV4TZM1_9BACT